MEKDQFRQSFIEMDGVIFLRLTNYEVMHQIDETLELIKNRCDQLKQKENNSKLLPLQGECPKGEGVIDRANFNHYQHFS